MKVEKTSAPLAANFTRNASVLPPMVGCMGFLSGKFVESVLPPIRILPLASTPTPVAESAPDPPMYVENAMPDPAGEYFTTKASVAPPLNVVWPLVPVIRGKSVDAVDPTTYAACVESTVTAKPFSTPLPPRYVEYTRMGSITSVFERSYLPRANRTSLLRTT